MSQTKEKQTPISPEIRKNEELLKQRLGFDQSFDVGVRKLTVFDKELQIYFVNGLCDNLFIIEILRELMLLDSRGKKSDVIDYKQTVINHLPHVQVEFVDTLEDAATQMLSGLISILVEGEKQAIVIDVRDYPGRGPEEPDTERVVRGARDGYTENIILNTGLTRRRIRDERLRNEILKVGTRSKTDVCISYIEGIADPKMVKIVKKELEAIQIDGISMADKIVEEYMVKQGMNPFPLVRYTERPDVAADHLLEGHIIILVDTSPSVIITPTTLFHHVQHAEEYRQAPMIGTVLRWVRFIGIMFSLLILPFWLLLVMQPSLLPAGLDFIGPEEMNNIPVVVQILFAELGIELLRMAAVHTPSPLATALGLVAAILIGELAVEVGYFTPEVILYIALGAIGMFATPSYELGIAFRMVRVLLILIVAFFKLPGFVIGLTVFMIALTIIKTFNKPYLWPFLPFDPPAMWHILVRSSVPTLRFRPSIVHPQNVVKQRSE
ncbi:spore germination protein [Halalkalibacter sp. APA_J-10(15)]|uniref:spore germination protein n=1 Tax=unclassified Halalkalibacter TaxID=2893063 RepID=UPI001FF35E06|nr:spore germination protein [Halalkalibacter sp. APA_J-10(15)]MCK0473155.1 spore germination protein [Halalkalibacter sp. APA_J-10(15)]